MKTPKFVKALLLSTALLTVASPAYAAPSPLSNTLTATFQVTAPPAPSFVIKWIDPVSSLDLTNPLPQQTAASGDTKDVAIKATVSQNYEEVIFLFKVQRTDGTPIAEGDVEMQDLLSGGTPSSWKDGTLIGSEVHISSQYNSVIAPPSQDFKFKFKFNTAGTYEINVAAAKAPT